jgi:hypothetical protein
MEIDRFLFLIFTNSALNDSSDYIKKITFVLLKI